MAGIYVSGALLIILMNAGAVLPTFALIFREAFNPTAGVAGTGIGVLLVTLNWGVNRGLFSNEAGQGSAPIAHAAAKTEEPVSEGVVGLVEPFIDTIVIVTMTCLVIIITGVHDDRVPSAFTLGGGDLSYVVTAPDGALREADAPAGIRVDDGRQETAAGQAAFAWHDVPVERFYVDEAQTMPFSGTIDPGRGGATGDDGTAHDVLYGDAPEGGAPLTQLGFQRGLRPLGDWGGLIVVLSVVLFALSTAISWELLRRPLRRVPLRGASHPALPAGLCRHGVSRRADRPRRRLGPGGHRSRHRDSAEPVRPRGAVRPDADPDGQLLRPQTVAAGEEPAGVCAVARSGPRLVGRASGGREAPIPRQRRGSAAAAAASVQIGSDPPLRIVAGEQIGYHRDRGRARRDDGRGGLQG